MPSDEQNSPETNTANFDEVACTEKLRKIITETLPDTPLIMQKISATTDTSLIGCLWRIIESPK